MRLLRRILALPILLLALIFSIGAFRMFTGDLPDSSAGEGVFVAALAAVSIAAAFSLLRLDLRGLSTASVRQWIVSNPLGQATLLYAAAAVVMVAAPSYSLAPGFLAQGVFSLQ